MRLYTYLVVLGFVLAACATSRSTEPETEKKQTEKKVKTFRCERYFVVKMTVAKKPTAVIVFAGHLEETGAPHFICADTSQIRVSVNESQHSPFYLTGNGQDLSTVYFRDGVLSVPDEKQREHWVELLERMAWEVQIPERSGRPVPDENKRTSTLRR